MVKVIMKALVLCFFVSNAYATAAYVKGKVEFMRVHHMQQAGWAPPIFWFTLQGISTAGTCKLWYNNVLFVGDSDQMNAMILSAYMSGKEVAVYYDDLALTSGYCKAQYVTLGDPAPLK